MPKYKVLVPSYIDGRLIDAKMIADAGSEGVVVDYDGIASDNLELVAGPGRKTKDTIDKENKDKLTAEAVALKAVRLDATGKATTVKIDGSESAEDIAAAIASMKQNKTL